MKKYHRSFLMTQFIYSGVSNAVLNGVALYLGNRAMKPLSWSDAASDAFLTCGFVSLLVTLPTAYFTGRARRAGLPHLPFVAWLCRLPEKKWKLWLFLWFVSAIVMETVFATLYGLAGFETLPFQFMLPFRIFWCGALGGIFGVLVGARYLQPIRGF